MQHHHPIRGALTADEAFVRARIHRAQYCHGIPYILEHKPSLGQDATFFITPGTALDTVDRAVIEIKTRFNVTSSTVLLVPESWLGTERPCVA